MAREMALNLVITADGRIAVAEIDRVGDSVGRVGAQTRSAAGDVGAMDAAFGKIFKTLAGFATVGAFIGFAKQAVDAADRMANLEARVRDATRETGEFAAVWARLGPISDRNGVALDRTVQLFQSLSRAAGELGATTDDILRLTDIVEKLGVISGASTSALDAGLLQLGQAMAAGTVRAEEFNSILENIPAVAEAIAAGMGSTVGELRQAVLEGKLLSADVFQAILSQAGDIEERFEQVPLTMERATNELSNAFDLLIHNLDLASGASTKIAGWTQAAAAEVRGLAESLDPVSGRIEDIQQRITQLEAELRGGSGDMNFSSVIDMMIGLSPAQVARRERELASLQQELADLSGALDTLDVDPAAIVDFADAAELLSDDLDVVAAAMSRLGYDMDTEIPRAARTMADSVSTAAAEMALAFEDANNRLRVQIAALGDASVSLDRYNAEARITAAVNKALAEGNAELALELESSRLELLGMAEQGIRLKSTLDQQQAAHREAAKAARTHRTALTGLNDEHARILSQWQERTLSAYEAEEAANEKLDEAKKELLKRMEFERDLVGETAREREILTAINAAHERGIYELDDAIRELVGSTYDLESANRAAAKAAADAAQEMRERERDIERSLTDALLRGFESGKDFAQNFVDTLRNLFSTLVLRPVIEAIVRPLAGGVSSLLPIGPGGGFDLSTLSSFFGGNSIGSGLMSLGDLLSPGLFDQLGFLPNWQFGLAGLFGGLFGRAFGTSGIGGGLGATAGLAVGTQLAGLGAFAGPIGAAIGAAIGIVIEKIFGGGNSDVTPDIKLLGGVQRAPGSVLPNEVRVSPDGGDVAWSWESGFGGFSGYTNHDPFQSAEDAQRFGESLQAFAKLEDAVIAMIDEGTAQAVRDAVANLPDIREEEFSGTDAIAEFFKSRMSAAFDAIGGDLDALFDTFATDIDFADPAQVAKLVAGIATISQATGDFADVLDLLTGRGGFVGEFQREGEVLIETTVRLAAELITVNELLELIGQSAFDLSFQGVAASQALIEIAGGAEALAQKLDFFYQNFFSEEERLANLRQSTTEALADLGIEFPETREDFRDLISGIDLTTESGRELFNALLELAPALDMIYDATEALAQAMIQQARDAQNAVEGLARDILGIVGDEVGIAEVGHIDRMTELQDRLNAAREAGNEDAIALLEEAIELEQVRYQLELEQINARREGLELWQDTETISRRVLEIYRETNGFAGEQNPLAVGIRQANEDLVDLEQLLSDILSQQHTLKVEVETTVTGPGADFLDESVKTARRTPS